MRGKKIRIALVKIKISRLNLILGIIFIPWTVFQFLEHAGPKPFGVSGEIQILGVLASLLMIIIPSAIFLKGRISSALLWVQWVGFILLLTYFMGSAIFTVIFSGTVTSVMTLYFIVALAWVIVNLYALSKLVSINQEKE